MLVESVRLRLLLVAPLRLVLGLTWIFAARAAGSAGGATLLAAVGGAFGIAFLASNDPRARFRHGSAEPTQLPDDAKVAPAWRHAVDAALPSTIGVSILAAVALAFRPTLSALLGGILIGLGLVAAMRVSAIDGSLFVDPRGGELFRK